MSELIKLVKETLTKAVECGNTIFFGGGIANLVIKFKDSDYDDYSPKEVVDAFQEALDKQDENFSIYFDGYLYDSGAQNWCEGLAQLTRQDWDDAYDHGFNLLDLHDIAEYAQLNNPEFLLYAIEYAYPIKNENHSYNVSDSLKTLFDKWPAYRKKLEAPLLILFEESKDIIAQFPVEEAEKIVRNLKKMYPDSFQQFLEFIPQVVKPKENIENIFNPCSVAVASLKINISSIYQNYENVLSFESFQDMIEHCAKCIDRVKPDNINKIILGEKNENNFDLILESKNQEPPNIELAQSLLSSMFEACNNLYEENQKLTSWNNTKWDKIILKGMLDDKLEEKTSKKLKKI